MNYARNYENMLNFVKVMPKILLVPFFRTRCSSQLRYSVRYGCYEYSDSKSRDLRPDINDSLFLGRWASYIILAISSRDSLPLGTGSVLIAGLTSTFRTPAKFISQWLNNITSSATLPCSCFSSKSRSTQLKIMHPSTGRKCSVSRVVSATVWCADFDRHQ